VRFFLQLKQNASSRMLKMDTCNRHIHIVVVFLTVGKTAAKQFAFIATDTLHCPSPQPTLPQTEQNTVVSWFSL
jgi:hypothetical protein